MKLHTTIFKATKEGAIELRTEEGKLKVFLVIEEGPNGEEEELEEIKTTSYRESDIISLMERIKIGLRISRIVSTIAGFIFGMV